MRHAIGEALITETQTSSDVVEWLVHGREDAATFPADGYSTLRCYWVAGKRIALIDDDFRFDVRVMGNDHETLELRGVQPSVRFHDTYGAARSAGEPAPAGRLLDAMELCGKTLSELVADATLSLPDVDEWTGQPLVALREYGADTRVISILPASYGDDRTGNREWLYTLDEGGRQSLWAEGHEAYQRRLTHRHIVYSMARPTMRPMANFTPLVLDNRSLLAPAAPLHRGEDLYQSALTRFLLPGERVFELPLGLGHWREGARKMAPPTPRTPGLSRFIADAVLATSDICEAQPAAERLGYAANVLDDLAAASNGRRQERLVQYLTSVRADTVHQLNQVLEQTGEAPEYWAADVRTLVETNALALTNSAAPKLSEWRTEATGDACAERLAADLRQHASGLRAWPALWSKCEGRLDEWLELIR